MQKEDTQDRPKEEHEILIERPNSLLCECCGFSNRYMWVFILAILMAVFVILSIVYSRNVVFKLQIKCDCDDNGLH
jgi:hypothetical protein